MQWRQRPQFDARSQPLADAHRHGNADPDAYSDRDWNADAHSYADANFGRGKARGDGQHDLQGCDQLVYPCRDSLADAEPDSNADFDANADANPYTDFDRHSCSDAYANPDAHSVAGADADGHAPGLWQPGQ